MENVLNFNECWYKEVCTNTCDNSCIRFIEMKYLMDNSGIPKAKQRPIKLTPSDDDYDAFMRLADIKDNIVDFVDSGKNLYITSCSTGNGKTSWAIKLMLKYFDNVWAGNGFRTRGLFIYTPIFLNKLKDFNTKDAEFDEIKRLIPNVDLIIWDDLCSNGLSDYDLSQLCNFIDVRILNEKANIFTGNLIGSNLEKNVGTRLYSRVWHTSEHIEFVGKDHRHN